MIEKCTKRKRRTHIGKFSGLGIISHGVTYKDVGGMMMDVFFYRGLHF